MKDAIAIGYRHIDTAMIYGNYHEIGAAVRAKIADGTVKREDLFVTDKVSRNTAVCTVRPCVKALSCQDRQINPPAREADHSYASGVEVKEDCSSLHCPTCLRLYLHLYRLYSSILTLGVKPMTDSRHHTNKMHALVP